MNDKVYLVIKARLYSIANLVANVKGEFITYFNNFY